MSDTARQAARLLGGLNRITGQPVLDGYGSADGPGWWDQVPTMALGPRIGAYTPPSGTQFGRVLVFEEGLAIYDGEEWLAFGYDGLLFTASAFNAVHATLSLRNGEQEVVLFFADRGQQHTVVRFLRRVQWRLAKRHPNPAAQRST